MPTTEGVPTGYEWKHVKLPRHESVYPSRWRECKYVCRDGHDTILQVLVREGQPGIRRLPERDAQA